MHRCKIPEKGAFMSRIKEFIHKSAALMLISGFLLMKAACGNTESAAAIKKSTVGETVAASTVKTGLKEIPVTNLTEAAPEKDWTLLKTSVLEPAGGKSLTVKAYGRAGGDNREIRAFLEYSGKSYEIGTISNYGLDTVSIRTQELNGGDTEELAITGGMGATVSVTKILGYDAAGGQWKLLLDVDNAIMADLDGDGGIEIASVSMGSLPPFLLIYDWDGKAYSMLDVASATGNEYAALKGMDSGYRIEAGKSKSGESPEYQYYLYRDGKLLPDPEASGQ
jgi:hypothetical protein